MWAGKGVIRTGKGTIRAGEGMTGAVKETNRAGQDFECHLIF